MDFKDDIVAISSPSGMGAISLIRVSGEKALEKVNPFFKSKNGTFIQTKVGIFQTFLIIIFGEEFSRLDESSLGKFYWPIIFL